MSQLNESPLPDDHPWSMYLNNLRVAESVTWYTTEESTDTLVAYVLELLELDKTQLKVSDVGFYSDPDESVLLTVITGPWGSGVTAFGSSDAGQQRINNAIRTEWEATIAALQTGSYVGNAAQASYAIISRGRLTEDWEGSPIIDYINASQIVHLWSFMRD